MGWIFFIMVLLSLFLWIRYVPYPEHGPDTASYTPEINEIEFIVYSPSLNIMGVCTFIGNNSSYIETDEEADPSDWIILGEL